MLSRDFTLIRSAPFAAAEPTPSGVAGGRSVSDGAPPMPSPVADIREQNIAFGKRADADMRPVVITPKSVRGYKLPSSALLHKMDMAAGDIVEALTPGGGGYGAPELSRR